MVLVFIVAFIILVFGLEKILNKLLGVEKKKISETAGKNVDRWGRGIILVIFLFTLLFVILKDTYVAMWYWIFYLLVLLGFQAFLEWKYLKNSKQFVTTLTMLLLGVTFIYNIKFIFKLFGWSWFN